jgi:transposase
MGIVYPQEFRDRIVELHRQGRSFVDLGKEFDLSPSSVANWVRQADAGEKHNEKRTSSERPVDSAQQQDKAEIARLQRELARKDEELEILGKALAFFARKTDQ